MATYVDIARRARARAARRLSPSWSTAGSLTDTIDRAVGGCARRRTTRRRLAHSLSLSAAARPLNEAAAARDVLERVHRLRGAHSRDSGCRALGRLNPRGERESTWRPEAIGSEILDSASGVRHSARRARTRQAPHARRMWCAMARSATSRRPAADDGARAIRTLSEAHRAGSRDRRLARASFNAPPREQTAKRVHAATVV